LKTVEKIERKLPVLKTRKRVAAYARVSMESERMQRSLSAQVSYYSALIQKNPEWEYAGVFADAAVIIGLKTLRLKKCQKHAAF
jgi:predicted site-specific integrase-resolvase